jgi:hypothetical protein
VSSRFTARYPFAKDGAPHLQTVVSVGEGSLHVGSGVVSFMVDSGAGVTTIGYGDRIRLGLAADYQFTERRKLGGIGGEQYYGLIDGVVAIRGVHGERASSITAGVRVHVAESRDNNFTLLGRDVLYRFKTTLINGLVTLEALDPRLGQFPNLSV